MILGNRGTIKTKIISEKNAILFQGNKGIKAEVPGEQGNRYSPGRQSSQNLSTDAGQLSDTVIFCRTDKYRSAGLKAWMNDF